MLSVACAEAGEVAADVGFGSDGDCLSSVGLMSDIDFTIRTTVAAGFDGMNLSGAVEA